MQKMTPCPATPGPTGPQSYRSPERVTYARPQNRGTIAAAVARVGIKMFMKFSTKSINEIHDQWCRDNGYPVPKPTSARARVRRKTSHKLRAQAGSLSLQAPVSGNQGKV